MVTKTDNPQDKPTTKKQVTNPNEKPQWQKDGSRYRNEQSKVNWETRKIERKADVYERPPSETEDERKKENPKRKRGLSVAEKQARAAEKAQAAAERAAYKAHASGESKSIKAHELLPKIKPPHSKKKEKSDDIFDTNNLNVYNDDKISKIFQSKSKPNVQAQAVKAQPRLIAKTQKKTPAVASTKPTETIKPLSMPKTNTPYTPDNTQTHPCLLYTSPSPRDS